MELILLRKWRKEEYTIGKLFVGGFAFCDTLEPTWRDLHNGEKKVVGKTAIPEGRYKLEFEYSPRFGRNMPYLKNVKGFEGIMLHPGNTSKDTSGCILVGLNSKTAQVVDSRATFNLLISSISSEIINGDCYLTVVNTWE